MMNSAIVVLPVLFTVITLLQQTKTALVLKACCGPNGTSGCDSFNRIEDMVGIACCSNSPMNSFTQLCCQSKVRDRKMGARFAELCCGDQPLAYDQTCCDGTVHNVASGACCGQTVYDRDDRSVICCNRTLTRAGPHDVCCGSEPFDSGRTQICCGQKVFEKATFDSCCEANNGTFAPFRSDTHLCCDTPQSRSAGRTCCYLRGEDGALQPTPYNISSQCCTYPYKQITQKTNGTCVE